MLLSTSAHAQATRTWVSGVGDDVNPCSRTAPCKTFAGAISKTASGGEIDVLDPGGFGTVTIVKPIILDGSTGAIGSILFSGTNGININLPTGGTVVLRNLTLTGSGTTIGPIAIRILKADQVFIENVKIQTAAKAGILLEVGAATKVFVQNTSIYNVNSGTTDSSAAVHVKDDASTVYLSNSTISGSYQAFSLLKDDDTVSTGKIISFNNNRFEGNTIPSTPTDTVYER
ncbi:hypothetical protein G7047_20745 [Diaphorobacter sp. HDW4A]|nr:hypothetical protein G7047_20745 [Diaphorobacter sp. HDW4A]